MRALECTRWSGRNGSRGQSSFTENWREVACSLSWSRCEFYVHLNLVRSCETPSDPTRCPLPPWHPSRPDRGLSCPVRPSFALATRAEPVRLVPSVRSACGFRGLAWMRAALRGICLFSLASLAILAGCLLALLALRNLAALRASLLILSCLAWFHVAIVRPSFRFNASQCSGFALPCQAAFASLCILAGSALHYSGQTGLHALRLCLVNVSILVQLLIFPCESTTYRT